jgi:adenylate cyclase
LSVHAGPRPGAKARLAGWIQGPGTRQGATEFAAGLGRALNQEGCRIARLSLGVPLLHPQVWSSRLLWSDGGEAVEELYVLNPEDLERLQASAMKIVYEGGGPVRCRLEGPPTGSDFPILADLRAAGMTDYLALALPFSDGSFKGITCASDRPGGFGDDEIELLRALVPTLAQSLEIRALRRTATTLLETYVGREAGRRVLAGQIRRGMGETIRAVSWLSDLRGFTRLSETTARDLLIGLLNDAFGVMCEAIEEEGGEVLKFIGDALLAIFPITGDAAAACARALAAARAAQGGLARVNAERAAAGLESIRYGIALHPGDVLYGNIGGLRRLDFTVIGPAVNLASSLEGIAAALGRSLVLSEAFVRAAGVPVEFLGTHPVKGLDAPQAVYAPLGAAGA